MMTILKVPAELHRLKAQCEYPHDLSIQLYAALHSIQDIH